MDIQALCHCFSCHAQSIFHPHDKHDTQTNGEYAGTAEEDPYLSDDSVDPDDMSYEVAI